jgi:hypothetical protein
MSSVSAHMYVNRGTGYDLPFREAIASLVPWCDEVIVGTDPRFGDATLEALQALEREYSNMRVVAKNFDFDHINPHGRIKQVLREECQGDWIVERDADEFIPTDGVDRIKSAIENATDRINLIALRCVHVFNGKWENLGMPERRTLISRNTDAMCHSLDDAPNHHGRYGAAYMTAHGTRLSPSQYLEDVEMLHLGWYSLPRKWEMKQTLHYYEGRLKGIYSSLETYNTNLDNEDVNFWDMPITKPQEDYFAAIRIEMHPHIGFKNGKGNNKLRPYRKDLPPELYTWSQRQTVFNMRRWRLFLSRGAKW